MPPASLGITCPLFSHSPGRQSPIRWFARPFGRSPTPLIFLLHDSEQLDASSCTGTDSFRKHCHNAISFQRRHELLGRSYAAAFLSPSKPQQHMFINSRHSPRVKQPQEGRGAVMQPQSRPLEVPKKGTPKRVPKEVPPKGVPKAEKLRFGEDLGGCRP